MKDVIVIDTDDALLVAKMGACQDVKKVAEYLKSGNRVEVERHLGGPPPRDGHRIWRHVPDLPKRLGRNGTGHDQPGANLMLDPVNNRELLVAKGELTVTTLTASRPIKAGERMDLATHLPTMLLNAAAEEAEVILLTMLGAREPAKGAGAAVPLPVAPAVPDPQAKAAHG